MTTPSSISAYKDEQNKQRRISHKERIMNVMSYDKSMILTNRNIARWTGLTYSQVWKRTAELVQEKKLKEVGETVENCQHVTLYQFNSEPLLFPVKQITWSEFAKKEAPELWRKYQVLIKHEL